MKKKLAALLAFSMIATVMTSCGDTNVPEETTEKTAEVTEAPVEEEIEEEEEEEIEEEEVVEETSEDFSLLDVTSDLVEVGVYAIDENKNELVFTMFNTPDNTPMASLFIYLPDGSGDVICGEYTADSMTDEDGITWTVLSGTDVYTAQDFEIGFAETDDGQIYILDNEGNPYEGKYLTNDETITYMGTAVALLSDESATTTAESSDDFSLLDVTSDMVEAGVYAIDDSQNELVFTMFNTPDNTPMASLFIYLPDGSGDVICGEYTAKTETDEDGIAWTLLTVSDVYTGQTAEIGFGEADGEVCIIDNEGTVYEGKYLTADETITYMGTAVALLS